MGIENMLMWILQSLKLCEDIAPATIHHGKMEKKFSFIKMTNG
jgi:hypothetical protein